MSFKFFSKFFIITSFLFITFTALLNYIKPVFLTAKNMAQRLITFLGRGNKVDGGYRTASYKFSDNEIYTTAYFGQALLQHLVLNIGRPVDEFIVLGTSQSIWDAMFDQDIQDDLWFELAADVENGTVKNNLLQRVEPFVADKMYKDGLADKVTLRIIPACRDIEEQIKLLLTLSDVADPRDELCIDITHGYRIMPMLCLVSAFFMQEFKQMKVAGIYYGALEMMKKNEAPVIRLDGLLRIAQWSAAVGAFKKSGDYGVFSHLIENRDAAENLKQAAFFEKILNIGQARTHINRAEQYYGEVKEDDPVFALFADQLCQFTEWSQKTTYAARQMAAAQNALETGNYVRAAALAVEAILTSRVPQGNDPLNYEVRQQAKRELDSECKQVRNTTDPFIRNYVELRDIRNALAHGTRTNRNTFNQQETLRDETSLQSRLSYLLNGLEKSLNSSR